MEINVKYGHLMTIYVNILAPEKNQEASPKGNKKSNQDD